MSLSVLPPLYRLSRLESIGNDLELGWDSFSRADLLFMTNERSCTSICQHWKMPTSSWMSDSGRM